MPSRRNLVRPVLLALSLLSACGRTTLSPEPRGPNNPRDGGIDGGACTTAADCADGLVCNGIEQCVDGRCVAGSQPECDDGIECTIDQCEETASGCIHVADNSRCEVGTVCDPDAGGCVERRCTSDAECSDGRFCNGEEVCVGGFCSAGTPPTCPPAPCNEAMCDLALDQCVLVPIDRDGDGFSPIACGGEDCNDHNPMVNPGATELCANVIDDDCDGTLDCADSDCAGSPLCCVPRPEVCNNGADDDCDRLIDCADPSCATNPACCTPTAEICSNSVDDDCDGLVDCADPSCATSPACCTPRAEVCDNGLDDDCDRLTDCADPNCATSPACCTPRPEICNNGVDDDCDRAVDCGDDDCDGAPVCCVPVPETCDDGADQDCDGLVDCADPDCRGTPACCVPSPEVCDNFVDDDCDRRVDCADSDCAGAPACCVPSREICDDGLDQDCDALIDCDDPDCAAAPACRPCPDRDLGSRLGRVATGTTVGAGNDVSSGCGSGSAEDMTFTWTAPFSGEFMFDTSGSSYDTVLAVRHSCTGPELVCDDDGGSGRTSLVRMWIAAGTTVLIVIDGFSSAEGSFELHISAIVSGEVQCGDGIDNDFDGDVDCADSDCATAPECAPRP